jgi:hypothetical protein
MKLALNVIAVVLLLTGVVWVGQGFGYIEGSFMTGDRQWALIGIVCIVIGVGLLVRNYRNRVLPPA